ncbi:MAG: amidohydrolase, partial [Chitinophagaceae bacterium]
FISKSTQVIDLNGKLVTPGFNDAHIHLLSGSLVLASLNLLGCTSLAEMKKLITDYAKQHPDKQWLTGTGWQYDFFPTGLPDKSILDSLVPDRPMYLRSYDGHSGLANSKALELAKINRHTAYKGFGEIVRDQKGEPTGVLKEGAQSLFAAVIPKPSREEKLDALRLGLKFADSLGITSLQNASGTAEEYELYQALLAKEELTLRVSMAFSTGLKTTEEEIQQFIKLKQQASSKDWLKAQAIKFMLDGVIESHTAVMLNPYSDLSPNDPAQKNTFALPLKGYQLLVNRLDQEGFQLYTHAIGDAAVREVLNAYEKAFSVNGRKGQRHRIEHIEQLSPTDLPRFVQLGIIPSMQPIHADPGTVEVWSKAVGKDRLPNSFPWQSLLSSGATLTFGSDWPACINADPIRGIHNAVNRRTIEGTPPEGWIPEQRVSLVSALKAYTYNGAYASFEEEKKGKLAKGYLADLIVLSKDLFTIPSMEIYQAKVVLKMVNG